MSLRLLVLCAALALAPAAAAAHDFWIQPSAFRVPAGAATPMTLQVGHGADRQRSRIPARRILRLAAVAPDGSRRDQRPSLDLGGPAADGTLAFQTAGGHVVLLETDNGGRSHLSGDRFRAYALEEGLTPALAEPLGQAEIWERYSRSAKAIVQVGDGGPQAQVVAPVGLPLEITPEAVPHTASGATGLPVRVLHHGRPLAGALVKLTDLDHDAVPLETRRTDAEGRARFTLPARGRWLLNVVWTSRLPEGEDAAFETIFSSLSFETP